MAEYILHDGIDDYNQQQQQQQQHRQQDLRYSSNNSSGGANHLSSLMLAASDDLEIPLINNDSNGTGNGGGGGTGEQRPHQNCTFGQKGFRPASSEYLSNKRAKQQLIVATLICTLFMVAELVGGLMAGSLAVVADAAHLLTDCIGFIVAMVAISIAKKSPDNRMTFGYLRFEVLGAFFSVLGIWLLTGILVYLAVLRVLDQSFEIDADTMIIISTIGVGINIVMASVLHGNCLKVPLAHGHSHGGAGHNHSHSHSHNNQNHKKSCKSSSAQIASTMTTTITSPNSVAKKDDSRLAHGVINMHSTSIHTTHSRHNSFSKTLPNGGNLLLDTSTITPSNEINSSANPAASAGTDKTYARINLEHHHNQNGHHPHHGRQNGNYTLLSIGNNEDALNAHHLGCDSDDETGLVGDDHSTEDNSDSDSDSDELGSDLKLGHTKGNHSGNINIRAAMIHVIGDFVQSVGVLISAVVIKFYPDAKLIDPACTFVFSVIVFFTTIRIMKESLIVLLDAVPMTINLAKLEKELRSIDGVQAVHYVNVFGVSVDWNVMSAHVVIDNMTSGEEVIRTVSKLVKRAYNIKHVTVQIERQKTKLSIAAALQQHHHHHLHQIPNGNELI